MEAGIKEAKNHLSKLVDAMLDGEEVFLTLRGTRVAQLVPVANPVSIDRGRGFLKHKLTLYPGWDSVAEDRKIERLFDAGRDA